MADNFRPTNKQKAQMAFRFAELSDELSKLGPLNDFEVATPRDVADTAYQTMTAPTTAPTAKHKDPRARKIAYSRSAEKLVIRFWDNTWWEYNNVPVDMWNDLKASDSTGKYLHYSGLNTHDDMGPFNPDNMAPEARVLFNEN